MTQVQTETGESKLQSAPPTLFTHIALPVRNLAAQLAFYEKYTTLKVIAERQDPETKLRTAWVANERDITPGGARFVLVLIEGSIPRDVVGNDMKEEYTFLTSFSHLGLSLDTREQVNQVAATAREEGTLVLGPMYRNEIVGYICIVRDPDGNNIEFSVEQTLG
jgi:catechol 2,3-dioxygenase-like lactoylglutathione lyase family enzyme